MSTRKLLLTAAAAAAALALSSAIASGDTAFWSSWQTWAGPGSGIVMGPGSMSHVVAVDLDGDGFVTKAEMGNHMRQVFMISDSDGNGGLSLPEYLAVRTATGQVLDQPKLDRIGEGRTAHFRALDLNSDGFLSPAEYYAGAEALYETAPGARNDHVAWKDYGVIDAQ